MKTNNHLIYFAFNSLLILGLMSCSTSQKSYTYPQNSDFSYNEKHHVTESSQANLKNIPSENDNLSKNKNQHARKKMVAGAVHLVVNIRLVH